MLLGIEKCFSEVGTGPAGNLFEMLVYLAMKVVYIVIQWIKYKLVIPLDILKEEMCNERRSNSERLVKSSVDVTGNQLNKVPYSMQ